MVDVGPNASADIGDTNKPAHQVIPEVQYKIWLAQDTISPKTAKKSYDEKHDEKARSFVEAGWAQAVAKNPKMTNGSKAIFYTKEGADSNTLKIVASDYAHFIAALKKDKPEDIKLRPHFATGVAVACITSDGHVIVGSRDANRDKKDPTQFPAQFPCGFIDTDQAFYEQIKNRKGLHDTIVQNGLRELQEEVFNFQEAGIEIRNPQFIGGIYKTQTWPSKETGQKEILNFKTLVVKCEVDITFAELEAMRQAKPPIDHHEMVTMGAVKSADVMGMNPESTVSLEGKKRQFVAEHGYALPLLAAHLRSQDKGQGMVR